MFNRQKSIDVTWKAAETIWFWQGSSRRRKLREFNMGLALPATGGFGRATAQPDR
jgi:hypothetical protein